MDYKIYKSFPRPRRFLGPILGTAPLMLALIGVARASGSGWVQVIGAIVSATILLGILTPMAIILRNKVFIENLPSFLVAKNENIIWIRTTKTCRLGIEQSPLVFLSPNTRTAVPFIPDHLGKLFSANLTISTAAPFGIVWWYRKITVVLSDPLLILPPSGNPDYIYNVTQSDLEQKWRITSQGQIRGARDYIVGDSLRNANWKTTAHVGRLQIKEFEIPSTELIMIDVEFYGTLNEIETHAEEILGTVGHLLTSNQYEIKLRTTVNSLPYCEQIQTLRQAQIQLAQADFIIT